MAIHHIPVLVAEVLTMLNASGGGHFLDCTLGGGGHTEAILNANKENTVVACDRDEQALLRTTERLQGFGDRVQVQKKSFSELEALVEDGPFDGILADLGLSTDQLYENRGFSFVDESPLDMRMDQQSLTTAADLVNDSSIQDLTRVFQRGGVGKLSRRYAEAIARQRPIENAKKLASLIEAATPQKFRKESHPATVVFQALRIEVNSEFEEVDALLRVAPQLSHKNSRFAVISFHSLEDKRVAGTFREWMRGDDAPAWWPGAGSSKPRYGKHLTPKAILPTDEEQQENRSSRSARLRVFEFSGLEERFSEGGE